MQKAKKLTENSYNILKQGSIYIAHEGVIQCLVIFDDRERYITGSQKGFLKVWNFSSTKELATLAGHEDYVTDVALSRDQTKIYSCSFDSQIIVWCASSYEKLTSITDHFDCINCLSLSLDGSRIVSANDIGFILTHNTQNEIYLKSNSYQNNLYDNDDPEDKEESLQRLEVYCLAISNDSNQFFSGHPDGIIKVWDLESLKVRKILRGCSSDVRKIQISDCGKYFLTSYDDTTVRIWDCRSFKCLRKIKTGLHNCVATQRCNNLYITYGLNLFISLWKIQSPFSLIKEKVNHDMNILQLDLCKNKIICSTPFTVYSLEIQEPSQNLK